MMKSRFGQLVTVCSIFLLLAQSSLSVSLKLTNRFETQNQWIQFIPPDEEFTAMLPARPTIRNYPIYNNPNATKHDRLLAHREYGGYGDGLVFVIHSFFIVLVVVASGAACLFLASRLVAVDPLSKAVSGFFALFWSLRFVIQIYYVDRGFLREHLVGHIAYSLACAFLGLVFLGAFWQTLGLAQL